MKINIDTFYIKTRHFFKQVSVHSLPDHVVVVASGVVGGEARIKK